MDTTCPRRKTRNKNSSNVPNTYLLHNSWPPVIHLWAFVLGHARIIMEYLLLYLCFLSLIFHSDLNKLVQIKSVFACTVMEFHPSAFSEWFFFHFDGRYYTKCIFKFWGHLFSGEVLDQSFSSPSLFGRK